ncbi:MAG: hypothetical protein LBJ41_02455 [Treponema sp.]|jgi:5-methyltetrahydropteroyltriglutamate--homocysteine methyltransferase|nr:hypothetical protein [Treponema sp.]
MQELALLAKLFSSDCLSETDKALIENNKSTMLIKKDTAGDTAAHAGKKARTGTYSTRSTLQHKRLNLPLLPTTTIGSFPQTSAASIREDIARTADIS